jgi:transposase
VKVVKDDALIVAVDIGMEMNRGYCTTPDGRNMKTFKFENTREGLDALSGMIMASKNRFKCNEVVVGYESTGPYGEPMLHYLMKKPVRIVQVNPMHTKEGKGDKR